ncbi:MAG: hypothetical protein BWY76_01373 [bacterium ADurb.Bin429]|nr:MAG: hypothetical protein BWY76_01373 [bacterium ADurb.Bin429]
MPRTAQRPPILGIKDGAHVLFRLAFVNDDGQRRLARQRQLPTKRLALHGTRRMVIMIVQPDLADGDHFRLPRQRAQRYQCFIGQLFTVMRMHADGGSKRRVRASQRHRPLTGGEIVADHKRTLHASLAHTRKQVGEIIEKCGVIQVRMRINHAASPSSRRASKRSMTVKRSRTSGGFVR